MLVESIVLTVLTSLGVVLIAALLARREPRAANPILALLIAVMLADYLAAIFLSHDGPFAERLSGRLPLALLKSPLLYLYVVAMTAGIAEARRVCGRAFAPFLLAVTWISLPAAAGGTVSLWEHASSSFERGLRGAAVVGVGAVFLALSLRRVEDAGRLAPAVLCCPHVVPLRWLRWILLLAFGCWVLGFVEVATPFHREIAAFRPVFAAGSLAFLTIYSLRHSSVFNDVRLGRETVEKPARMPPEELRRQSERLEALFAREKPYLDPDLRLGTLAERLALRPDQLSTVLSDGLGTSFYAYVNRHRVEEAKRRLRDPASSHLSIVGVALECGFNTKSSFAEAFRRFAGSTPSAFRRGETDPA